MMRPGGDGDDASSSARKRRRRPEPSPTQRALSLLTRREHSKRELARKLLVALWRYLQTGELPTGARLKPAKA